MHAALGAIVILSCVLAPAGSEDAGVPRDAPTAKRISLTLEECVRRAFTNNVTLEKSRDAAASTATGFEEAMGSFDPAFFTDVEAGETIRPTGSDLVGGFGVQETDQDSLSVVTGFRGLLFSGATYQFDLSLFRSYYQPSGFMTVNPQVYSTYGFQVKQPLLKAGWTTYNLSGPVRAAIASRQEDLNLETTLNETIFSVIEAYWNLVYAIENLATSKESLQLAENLLTINTRKRDEGLFGKLEVLEAQASVAEAKELLITARNGVKSAEDNLKRLICPSSDSPEWLAGITPLTEPEVVEEKKFDIDSLIGETLQNRPDYQALVVEKKTREVDILVARNETLPRLDLTGSYRLNALGTNPGNSFDDLESRKYRSFNMAVNLEIPMGNRAAESMLKRSLIEMRKAETALREKEIEIVYELREAVRDISLQREKMQAAGESKRLSEERYRGELKLLEVGRSIPYQVREAERNYLSGRDAESRAFLDYQIALVKLEKIKGNLLTAYGIRPKRSLEKQEPFVGL